MVLSREDLGQLIKKARKLKANRTGNKYTQSMLASDLGVSRSYLGDIETGRTYPSYVLLNKIAQMCEVPLSFFSNIDQKIDEYVSSRLSEYHSETQEMVKDYIHTGAGRLNFLSGQAQHDITVEGFPLKESSAAYNLKTPHQTISDSLMTRLPILGTVAVGIPLYAEQNILGYEDVPRSLVKSGEYFFLIVRGDSMIGSRILPGDKVLIRRQPLVENGEIALVLVDGDEATLKRVKFIDKTAILYPDNPSYSPMIYPVSDVEIIGYVAQVVFNPNAKK